MKPEQTQGGGFAGGVFTGPGAAPPRSSLFELAESIGAVNKSVTGSLVDDFGRRIETNKKAALDEAAIFEQTTAGYTSEKLNAEIESEPMAARFKANPYLLPAINVYRGRKLADELGLKMVQEGVDTGDAEAVQTWYQTNAPDLSDPFYARGFNEQNSRLQAQFSQQQLKDALSAAEEDRLAGAGEIWREAFFSTGDVNAAKAAVDGSVFGSSIDGKELAGIQFEFAKQLALEGNMEMLNALVNTKRGDAPPLSEDARYAGDVATLVAQAELKRTQDEEGFRNTAQVSLLERINSGVSRQALVSSPEFAALSRPGQQEGALSQEQTEVLRAHISRQESLRQEAERRRVAERMEAAVAGAEARAASLVASGQGFMVESLDYTDPETGKTKKIPASTLVTGAVNFLRKQALGDQPFSLQGEDAQRYRVYTDALAASGQVDPMLKKALTGYSSALTAEGVVDSPETGLQALTIFSNMSPAARSKYVTDARTTAILEKTEAILDDNPRLDPAAAIKRAVAMADSPVRLGPASKPVKDVIKDIRIVDPQGQRGWFGLGSAKKFSPDAAQVKEFVADRMTERRTFGMTEEEAAAAVAKEASEMFVAVNGMAVRLPEQPLASGISPSPENWARDVLTFTSGFAASAGVPQEELQVIWNTGNSYSVIRRSQEEGVEPEFLGYVSAADIYLDAVKTRQAAFGVFKKVAAKPATPPTLETVIDDKREKQSQADANTALALGMGVYNPDN